MDSRQTRGSARSCFVELVTYTPLSLASFVVVSFPAHLKCPKFLSYLLANPLTGLTYSFVFYLVPIGVLSDRLTDHHFEGVASRYEYMQNEYRG